MKDNQASYTAEGAAGFRAAGTCEADPVVRNPDYLAGQLIRPRFRFLATNPLLRRLAVGYYHHILPGMYECHLARTHHFDAIVKQELQSGIEQLIILGAGLDSRPYRFQSELANCRVFEVDFPASGEFKQQRLVDAGIKADHVTFVPVDFQTQNTEEQLLAKGLDKSLRTLVTWEGVIMYLNADAVHQVMQFVASLGKGSSIVFDYAYPSFFDPATKDADALKHQKFVAKVGEPYTFGLAHDEVAAFLAPDGLSVESNLDATDIDKTYLPGRSRGVTPWYAIAHARAV